MGYDLHVTRADDWSMNDEAWITADEWLAAVRGDAELQLIADSEPYPAEWLHDPTGCGATFEWSEGNILAKNPTKPVILKLEALANVLRAKVQGDDGEVYRGGAMASR